MANKDWPKEEEYKYVMLKLARGEDIYNLKVKSW